MRASLKAGIISGLIAGIFSMTVYGIFSNIAISMGLWEPWWGPIWTGNILVNVPLGGFLGHYTIKHIRNETSIIIQNITEGKSVN